MDGISVQAGMARSATSAAYFDAVLADSPLGYWRLGESSGTTAVDEQGLYNLSYTGSPTLGATGVIAGNTAVGVSTGNIVLLSTAVTDGRLPVTYEIWLKTTATVDQNVFICGDAVFSKAAGLSMSSAGLPSVYSNGNGGTYYAATGTTAVNDGNWHHIVGVITTAGFEIFVDSVSEGTLSQAMTAATDYSILVLGAFTNQGGAFTGTIDEAALYHSALSSGRIAAHYSAA